MYSSRIVWVEPTMDLERTLRTGCPDCGQEMPVVRGTAAEILIADHLGHDGETCTAAKAEIHRRLRRLKTWEEVRWRSNSARPGSVGSARIGH